MNTIKKPTGQMENYNGIPIFRPNDVPFSTTSFYISYNSHSSHYGSDTTALVETTKENTKFLILNGNHTKQYNEIVANGGGYNECLQYFKNNADQQNKFSENWNEITVFENGKLIVKKDERYI